MDNRDANSSLSCSQCLSGLLNCWRRRDFWVSLHFPLPRKCTCLISQSCAILCNHKDCSPPGSSVHRIFQARILEWITISYSRRSSRPRDGTQGRNPALLHWQADSLPLGNPTPPHPRNSLNSISSEGSSLITLPNGGLLQAPSFKAVCVFPQKYPSPPALLLYLCTEALPWVRGQALMLVCFICVLLEPRTLSGLYQTINRSLPN